MNIFSTLYSLSARVIAWGAVTLILLVVLLETGSAFIYYQTHPLTLPPIFGGPGLDEPQLKIEDLSFDPFNLYSNQDIPANDGLYARPKLQLPAKKNNEYRVFLLGSSTVANVRVAPGNRISDHIESTLRHEHPNARVFNFGVPSYTSFRAMQLMVGRLIYEQPDLVVLYDGFNDVFYGSLLRNWRANLSDVDLYYHKLYYEGIQKQMNISERWNYWLESTSYTKWLQVNKAYGTERFSPLSAAGRAKKISQAQELSCLSEVTAKHSPSETYLDHAIINEQAVNALMTNIEIMRGVAETAGIKYFYFLQPTPASKRNLFPCEQRGLKTINALYPGASEALLKTYEIIRTKAAQSPDLNGVFIDLSQLTDNINEELYFDYVHEHPKGRLTKIAGETIAGYIAPLIPKK